ncbi:glycosyltransferase [Halomonas sp. E14]|uniref:glycosyltransferase n=1 Tax=Halomonas sp. E14 TaxID=3397245 RepID=UPI00403E5147
MHKEKTVLFFLAELNGGGAEKVMIAIANYLANSGVKVMFVIVKSGGPYMELLTPKVELLELKTNSKLVAIFELRKLIGDISPFCVFSSILGPCIILALANLLAGSASKLVLREANTPSVEASKGSVKQRIMRRISRLFYPRADMVIAVSKAVEKDLKEYYGHALSCKTIYNPVNIGEILELASQDPVMALPWGEEAPILISAGRLSKQKDYLTLLRAFHSVAKVKNCKLIILGEGELRSELEKAVEELGLQQHIWLPGFVSNPFPYFKKARVFVLSSQWEGMPNVLIHALAMGLKIVSTDCPSGPREITDNGRLGRLVEVGNVDDMANAIVDCLSVTENFEKYDFTNYVEESFSSETILSAYREILTTP